MPGVWRDALYQLVLLPEGCGRDGGGGECHSDRRVHTAHSEVSTQAHSQALFLVRGAWE